MKNKKEKIIAILLVVGLIVATGSISYAAFRFSGLGSKVNTITTGSITMSYTESSNVLSMSGALPTTDATGKVRLNPGEYFDFTVSSSMSTSTNINYEIAVEELEGNTMSGDYIKFYLTKVDTEGNEEEVMAPSTYSADLNANTYTGRPANMMSLYTSSMSASETTTYRLRMYVSEEYNPQGDGGNLIYKARVNVYGLAGEKVSSNPQIITKLLADNPVQEEKAKMFNYTSEGVIVTNPSDGSTTTNAEYVTNGMYMMEDEDGESYYFRGNVNNIVQFGSYEEDYYVYRYEGRDYQTLESCQAYNSSCSESNKVVKYTAGTPMYWRIVRVNGDKTLRLLYSGTSKDATGDDVMIGYSKYNSTSNDPKYTGYTYDNGTDSLIKKEVDEWYKNAFSTSSYDKYIASGRFCSDSSNFHLDSVFDENVYASFDRLGQAIYGFATDNTPTLICPETTESYGGSYRLKAGLMTVDEMVLGGDSFGVPANNYLSVNSASYWTMSPANFNNGNAYAWYRYSYLDNGNVYSDYMRVRPVINLLTDNGLTLTGSGSSIDPYVIK